MRQTTRGNPGARRAERTDRQRHRPEPRPLPPNSKLQCTVSRIADGDSFYCGSEGRIRLLMIDAPELAQGDAGGRSQAALEAMMPKGTEVNVETDVRSRDRFDRILGYVYLPDGRMVNEEMARSGYVTALVYPPNVREAEKIRRAVADARRERKGLWATQLFACSPRDYRAGRCARDAKPRSN
ncbi:MAG TPA: thermonuclease family protein [Gemmatimonadaceae bacterium]|nr:thermonuclease family protein [Gemmatimonadaceae bacterium]